MEASNDTYDPSIRDGVDKAATVIYPTLAAVGILANLFVIMVIIVTERSRPNRTVANTFVLQLAIADVLFLITLPFHVPSTSDYDFQFSQAACQFTEALKHIAYHSSILFLTGMSIDRYMAIVHSLQSMQFRTQRNARIACALLWIVSISTAIPVILFAEIEEFVRLDGTIVNRKCALKFPGHKDSYASYDEILAFIGGGDTSIGGVTGNSTADLFGTGSESMSENFNVFRNNSATSPEIGNMSNSGSALTDFDFSSLDYGNSEASTMDSARRCSDEAHTGGGDSPSFRAWQISTFVLFFIIPLLIIILCYFQIWRATAVRKVRSQKAEGYTSEQETLHTESNNEGTNRVSWKEIQTKVTRMVLVLVSAFIICWLPFQLWIILTLPPGISVNDTKYCYIYSFLITMLAWSNSLMNPILYSITSENFRKRAVTTVSFLRYGYRRTMRMSVTRSSRTGHGFRTEKTDMNLQSVHPGTSPKNDKMMETQTSPPPTPITKTPPQWNNV